MFYFPVAFPGKPYWPIIPRHFCILLCLHCSLSSLILTTEMFEMCIAQSYFLPQTELVQVFHNFIEFIHLSKNTKRLWGHHYIMDWMFMHITDDVEFEDPTRNFQCRKHYESHLKSTKLIMKINNIHHTIQRGRYNSWCIPWSQDNTKIKQSISQNYTPLSIILL